MAASANGVGATTPCGAIACKSRSQTLKDQKSIEAAKFVVQFESDEAYSTVDWSRVSNDGRSKIAVGGTVRIRCLPEGGYVQPGRISFIGTDGECEQYLVNMTDGGEFSQVCIFKFTPMYIRVPEEITPITHNVEAVGV